MAWGNIPRPCFFLKNKNRNQCITPVGEDGRAGKGAISILEFCTFLNVVCYAPSGRYSGSENLAESAIPWISSRHEEEMQSMGTENSSVIRLRNVSTPGALLLYGFVLALLIWWAGGWICGLVSISAEKWNGAPPREARAQLRALQSWINPDQAIRMGKAFPEGRLFTYSFYGFALLNMATARPDDAEFHAEALAEMERIIPIVTALGNELPFSASASLKPKGGIIAAGHRNLLSAGYALLGGKNEAFIRAFHEESALLEEEYRLAKIPILESYAHNWWPVDNFCALESLRLHDVIYDTDYSEARNRFFRWIRDHLDAETGMMVSQVADDNTVLDGPRGCALSWTLAFMPALEPDLARELYQRYRDQWFIFFGGATGIREWPAGLEGRAMDADSGPVVADIGAGASGLGIAAAKANGDWENFTRMVRGMELLSFPVWTLNGEKYYFARQVILCDILALWGKTIHPWDQSTVTNTTPWPAVEKGGLLKSLVPTFLLIALLSARVVWGLVHAWRGLGPRSEFPLWNRSSRVFFGVECALLLTWLLMPVFPWYLALLALIVLNLFDCGMERLRRRRLLRTESV